MPSRRIGCRAHRALSSTAFVVALVLMAPVGGFAGSAPAAQSLPKVTADRTEIIKKLFAHQFDTLNSELMAYDKKAESDPHFEMNAMVAFGAFYSSQSAIGELLKEWCKAQPHCYAAKLAHAEG